MKRSEREFGVYKLFREEGRFAVDGRCFEAPLAVGDVFRQVYHLAPDRPTREPDWKMIPTDFRRVALRIDEIIFYRQSVDSLDSGYTGRLFLSGEGVDLVQDDGNEVLGIEMDAS